MGKSNFVERFKNVYESHREIINIIVLVLTFVMFFIALVQTIFSWIQTKQLGEITENIYTRYLGKFPSNISDITENLDKAQDSILILSDMPGYGVYSSSKGFEKYYDLLNEKIINKLTVTLICYGKKERAEQVKRQFKNTNKFEFNREFKNHVFGPGLVKLNEIKKPFCEDDKESKNLFKFIKKRSDKNKNDIDSLKKQRFFVMIDSLNNSIESNFRTTAENASTNFSYKTISIPGTGISNNIFAWIIDGRYAIFSLVTLNSEDELTFFTMDPNMIAYLNRYIRNLLEQDQEKKQNN